MIQVESPRGLRTWVSIERSAQAARVAEKAARLLGYAEDVVFRLADGQHRILTPHEPVVDGESYELVVQLRGSYPVS